MGVPLIGAALSRALWGVLAWLAWGSRSAYGLYGLGWAGRFVRGRWLYMPLLFFVRDGDLALLVILG